MCSYEDELQRELKAKSELILQAPNKTHKGLSGACYAAFEVHLLPMQVIYIGLIGRPVWKVTENGRFCQYGMWITSLNSHFAGIYYVARCCDMRSILQKWPWNRFRASGVLISIFLSRSAIVAHRRCSEGNKKAEPKLRTFFGK